MMDDFDARVRTRMIALADAAERAGDRGAVRVAPVFRGRTRSLLPAAAGTVAVVVLVSVMAVRLIASPGPTGPASVSSSLPGGGPALSHYAGPHLSFDYPAQWRLIADHLGFHYVGLGPVVGTGDWSWSCATLQPTGGTTGGITCGPVVWTVPPGAVVVEFSSSAGPPGSRSTPPPDAIELAGGVLAADTESPTASIWQFWIPNVGTSITVEARYAAPRIELARGQVRALIESFRWKP